MTDTTKAPEGANVRKLPEQPNPHTAAATEYNLTPGQRADAAVHDRHLAAEAARAEGAQRGQRIPAPSGPQRVGDLARQLTGIDHEISKLAAIVGLLNSMSTAERERTMAYVVDRFPSAYDDTEVAK